MTRQELVNKIAQVIADWEESRDMFDQMSRLKFTICFKMPADIVADARQLVRERGSYAPND